MPPESRERDDLGAGERGLLEERHVEHRLGLVQLREDERGEQHDGGREEADGRAAAPAPVAAAQQREDERKETSGEEHEAEQVEAAMLLVARLVQVGERAEDAEGSDRQVDEEDPAPAGVLGQEAADERADRDGEPDRRAPDPERGAALAAVELLREDRERDREHRRAADALEAAGEVEEEGSGGRAAEGGGER